MRCGRLAGIAGVDKRFACNRGVYHARKRGLDSARGAHAADEERMTLAPHKRDHKYEPNQNDVTEIPGPARQTETRRRDFGEEVLKETERANPSADERSNEPADKGERPERDKGEDVERGKIGDNTDRTGEGRQRTGVTVIDTSAEIVEAQEKRVKPDKEKRELDPEAFAEPMERCRWRPFGFGHRHYDPLTLLRSDRRRGAFRRTSVLSGRRSGG